MHFTFSIEAGQSSGTSFRLALGISVPVGLVWAVCSFFGLS